MFRKGGCKKSLEFFSCRLFESPLKCLYNQNNKKDCFILIHPTAVVDPLSCIETGVEIGPYCVIGEHVTLKKGVRLFSHVVIEGRTTVGEGCTVYPFCSIGHAPQDLKYKGEPSTVTIGASTTIREYVTIQPGTEGGGMETSVGEKCLLMAHVHIAHDCRIGHGVIMANHVTLGGHVVVGDGTVIGGLAAIHQFVRIGQNSMIGGTAGVTEDVIPYGLVVPGKKAFLEGLNLVGLKRGGFSTEEIQALREFYKRVLEPSVPVLQQRMIAFPESLSRHKAVQKLMDFLQVPSTRGLCLPKRAVSVV